MSPLIESACLFGALALIVVASYWPRLQDAPRPAAGQSDPIQGLRGLLAIGVFTHHAQVWRHFLAGQGAFDPRYFFQFGQCRVVLFFMLTAFLFYGRLVDVRRTGKPFDWLRLAVSRVLRLGPLYWLVMLLMFAIVAIAFALKIDGAGTSILRVTPEDVVQSVIAWMSFSMLGMPAIANYIDTKLIVAGVTWTLPYEWSFYLLLPLFALALRVRMTRTALGIGLLGALWLVVWDANLQVCAAFVGGMAAAVLVRLPAVAAQLRRPAAAAFVPAAIATIVALFENAYDMLPLCLLAGVVAVVGAGNDLLGLLRWRAAQWLGARAYGIYLLHGMGLYTMFMFVIGQERGGQLGDGAYWAVVVTTIAVVLLAASAARRWVESPALRQVDAVTAGVRRLNASAVAWGRRLRVLVAPRLAK